MNKNIDRTQIVAAARGDVPMDLVIREVNLVNVFTAEIYVADIGIKEDRFAAIARYEDGKPQFYIEGERAVSAKGSYAMPGFIDAHVHIESTMMAPDMFARAVLRHGTTVAVIDPHEIANVMGAEGVKQIVKASQNLPVRVLTTIPSCVPAVQGIETAGAEFLADDIAELLDLPDVVGIAELMDYTGVIKQDQRMADIVHTGLEHQVLNEGHAPRVTGRDLHAYLAAGVHSEHESRGTAEIVEKLRAGMNIYIRESSVSKFADIAAQALQQLPHASNVQMCTDDIAPHDIIKNGQMNRVIRRCIEEGIPAALAIRYATLNGAMRFGLRDVGAIAAGYLADLVLVDSLETMEVTDVYVKGEQVVADGQVTKEIVSPTPLQLPNTVRIPELVEEDFMIKAPIENGKATIHTVEVTKIGITTLDTVEVDVVDGKVSKLPEDCIFISVTGRHGQNRKPFVAVMKNAGLREGAYATTMAHDSHNLVVAGKNPSDMLAAAEQIKASGGGLCLVKDGNTVATVELPLAGLMAPEPIEELAPKVENFAQKALEMGVKVGRRSPVMAFSSISLTVIPEVRVSDLGLVDVNKQEFISLFV
ncbi:adenine deaminase [Ornithinibacillus sp. 4-3]|uniref:Adenine deaminase n=1 Tax=Ornithinibacillus sp. 4-3 TaxID=3231488 RepID=A0AB39HK53_9BACI